MTRVAILIDGGYLIKRLPVLRPEFDINNPAETASAINHLAGNHLNHLNKTYRHPNAYSLLHRIFYYDAEPVDLLYRSLFASILSENSTLRMVLIRGYGHSFKIVAKGLLLRNLAL